MRMILNPSQVATKVHLCKPHPVLYLQVLTDYGTVTSSQRSGAGSDAAVALSCAETNGCHSTFSAVNSAAEQAEDRSKRNESSLLSGTSQAGSEKPRQEQPGP